MILALTLVACAVGPEGSAARPTGSGATVPSPAPASPSTPSTPTGPDRGTEADERTEPDEDATPIAPNGPAVAERPSWLGTRALPLAPDGFGVRLPTPPELVDRRLPPPPSPSGLPEPPADGTFASTVGPVPPEVVARSTWRPDCPVALDDLRYVTATFVGFDGRAHTGELVVHADLAEDVVAVMAALHAAAFPLEEVRVIAAAELSLPPTGDGNVTTAFVCRPAVGSTRWSEHASGRALDVNPFHNPYVRGDLVLPELAGAYVDRAHRRPGMVLPDGPVEAAFAAVGWRWGGRWTSALDWMHFSPSGR